MLVVAGAVLASQGGSNAPERDDGRPLFAPTVTAAAIAAATPTVSWCEVSPCSAYEDPWGSAACLMMIFECEEETEP